MQKQQKTLIALGLSLALFSCSSNEPVSSGIGASAVNLSYEVVAPAALPTTISDYVAAKYAGSTTNEVNLLSNGTYVMYVTLAAGSTAKTSVTAKTANTNVKLNFNAKGLLLRALTSTPVLSADLLPAITSYIATNYSNATITSAHLESDGSFDVIITAADASKVKLNFTATGTFVAANAFKPNGNHKHNHNSNQTPVAIADLATSITTYITTNYAGATITSAHKEADSSFDVYITTVAGANLNLNFSAAGEFVSVSSSGNNHTNHETPITVANLLAEITTYINTNYAGATITSAEKDWNSGFEVHLTTASGVRLELNFTALGVFVIGSDSNNNHPPSMVALIIKDLITNIKTYITTNYAGATITAAHLESDGSFDIFITTTTGTKLKLNFTSTGVFVSAANA